MPRIVDIIEARMKSSRLPGKVLQTCQGKPMLAHQVERLRRSERLDGVVIATTVDPADDPIEALARELGVGCHRGSEDDVLQRVLDAADAFAVDIIVETPGDCPLIDWQILDRVVDRFLEGGHDYACNNMKPSYPGSMDVQVFPTEVLRDVARRTDDATDHEHVTLYIYRHQEIYRCLNVEAPPELTRPDLKFQLDTPDDLAAIRAVFDALYLERPAFTCADIIALVDRHPEIAALNRHVQRTKV